MRVSVIVMTHSRPLSLRRCLESLVAQTMPQEAFELVVVDVSTPEVGYVLAEFADRLHLIHHVGPNLGVAGNRNTGVARAEAPVIAFLDDDCVAAPDWLERITARVEANPRCLVGGLVEHPAPANSYAAAGQVITEAVDAFFNPPGSEPRFLPGLNFAVEREGYLAIGGCDGRFGRLAAEDRDFIDRWRIASGGLVACPDAVVRHEHRAALRGFVRQYFNYGRGAWRYHSLRRKRSSGRMAEDLRLHLGLPSYLGQPLGRLAPGMKARVIALLGVWQLANLAGFLWQGALETIVGRNDLEKSSP
ncbi:glycosyl transferase family A [Deltaproteobacteria bacterium]|nr:glycosyl transferase family A [Deltaproteobacteria bacterium]